MASPLLIDYFNRCRANYQLHDHAPVERSVELAQVLRVPPRRLVKSVLVRVDGTMAMVLLPADIRLSLDALRRTLGAMRVELADERNIVRCFPRCERGTIPPVGHLFGLNAYALPLFDRERSVFFCAGSRSRSVEMPFAEFRRLAHFDEINTAYPAGWGGQPLPAINPSRRAPRSRELSHRAAAAGHGAVALQGW